MVPSAQSNQLIKHHAKISNLAVIVFSEVVIHGSISRTSDDNPTRVWYRVW